MTVTITIQCDNDAFEPEPRIELESMLEVLAERIYARHISLKPGSQTPLLDSNGNTIGSFEVSYEIQGTEQETP